MNDILKDTTPGPWKVNYRGNVITDSPIGEIHRVISCAPKATVKNAPPLQEQTANAALIAAAPELAAEVERLRAALRDAVENVNHKEEQLYWEYDAGPDGPVVVTVEDYLQKALKDGSDE